MASNMVFTGTLTEADFSDVLKLARSKTYWLRVFKANWYATVLVVGLLWATIAGLMGQLKPNWRAVELIWAVAIILVLWGVFRTKRARVKLFSQFTATLPEHINLTSEGVKLDGPNGASAFLPWRNFKGWREGRRVVLVDQCHGTRFVTLPISQLHDNERQSLRQFLKVSIPPPTA